MTERNRTDVGDALRFEFALETAERLVAHVSAFAAYMATGDVKAARGFWECARLCGKAISTTIDELDGGGK